MFFPLVDIGLLGKTRLMPPGWFARPIRYPDEGAPGGIAAISC
jgi:hypothetical protein